MTTRGQPSHMQSLQALFCVSKALEASSGREKCFYYCFPFVVVVVFKGIPVKSHFKRMS